MLKESNNVVLLADGRQLAYAEFGDPQGVPVMYFHGYPGSRLEAVFSVETAMQAGARVIAVERPGYGISSFQADRQLMDWPADVVQLAEALNLERFSILGVSAGSTYALACAVQIPERLLNVGIAGALAPLPQTQLHKKMGWQSRYCFAMTQLNNRLSRLLYGRLLGSLIRNQPEVFLAVMGLNAAEADRQVMQQGVFKQSVVDSMREAFRQGYRGPYQDLLLVSQEWGFALEDVHMPIHLWHGEADSIIPVEMGAHLAEKLPDIRATFLPGEGHFSMTVNYMQHALEVLCTVDASATEQEKAVS